MIENDITKIWVLDKLFVYIIKYFSKRFDPMRTQNEFYLCMYSWKAYGGFTLKFSGQIQVWVWNIVFKN